MTPLAQRVGIAVLAVIIRCLVGLSDYSGFQTPPKFGDYEAQRHWMELMVNLPPTQWYVNSSSNNGSYWPLDYPPLSGYQSWLHGQLLLRFEPEAVALLSSHGYETPSSKMLMRLTVVLSDILVYFPAAVACMLVFGRGLPPSQQTFILAVMLLNPALIIIDHGHFQYNCISLGLAAGAAAALGAGRQLLGSFLFCLSLNHKQMGLFFAPAFFAHLLGWALQHKGMGAKVLAVAKLGATVIVTFAACWASCLSSPSDVLVILQRVFPIKRGLYEDYVANFWCATSVVIKWRELLPQPLLLKLCAGVTLSVALPAMVHQMMRPSPRGLLLCMANSAMAFFMFSFQVHEKSILLPLLPLTVLAASEPALALWVPLVACFSMYPLLHRDGVIIAYAATMLAYLVLLWPAAARLISAPAAGGERGGATAEAEEEQHKLMGRKEVPGGRRRRGAKSPAAWLAAVARARHVELGIAGLCAGAAMHAARELVAPPPRLPWLHDRAFVTAGFAFFAATAMYLQARQWQCPPTEAPGGLVKGKKTA